MRLARPGDFDNGKEGITQDDGNVRVKIGCVSKASMAINLVTDKDKHAFITDCEKMIRTSLEYKQYIEYLKEYRDMTKCKIFTNIESKQKGRNKIRIEIHHEPFTLYDIVNTVVNKHIACDWELNYFSIASEVMDLHYRNLVGLIPLSLTVHKLVHLGRIFIPLQCIDGNFIRFYDEYEEYIPTEVKNILVRNFEISRDIYYGTEDNNITILDKKYIFIEQDGITLPHIIEDDEDHI